MLAHKYKLIAILLGFICFLPAHGNQFPQSSIEIPADIRVIRNINYVTGSLNPAQSLDLYLPVKTGNTEHRLPVIVLIHGGGWLHGDKTDAGCVQECIELVHNGYAAASINYRLSSEAIWPAQIHDCKASIRWLRAHAAQFNLDQQRIGTWGSSSGGHLAAMLGTTNDIADFEGQGPNSNQSSAVQAVCDWFGPADFLTLKQQVHQTHISRDILTVASLLLGGALDQSNENAIQASPVMHVTDKSPVFLIMHGDADHIVPLAQSQELVNALHTKGVDAKLVIVPDSGHALGAASVEQALQFFNQHLK